MICIKEDCDNPVENENTGLCSTCSHALRKHERQQEKKKEKLQKKFSKQKEPKQYKQIPKISDKQAKYLLRYIRIKDGWLTGKFCAVNDCPDVATEIHHKKGRSINEFLDEMAAQHDIPLLLDQRTWLPVCHDCHSKITVDSKWAIENGYSLRRI